MVLTSAAGPLPAGISVRAGFKIVWLTQYRWSIPFRRVCEGAIAAPSGRSMIPFGSAGRRCAWNDPIAAVW